MTWKPIKDAPRDGTVLILGHTNYSHVEYYGKWGIHKQSGVERWVDGQGNGLFDATHFDFLVVPPRHRLIEPLGCDISIRNLHHIEYDANNDPYSYFDHADLIEVFLRRK